MSDVRILSLHQPWASLIATGAKQIETRSWSTKYRGRLLIHASKRWGSGWAGWMPPDDDRCNLLADAGGLLNEDAHGSGYVKVDRYTLPLGAVVASAMLVDVVPIEPGESFVWTQVRPSGWTCAGNGDLFIDRDQEPLGDFSPGRFAWLLDDVRSTRERCPRCWPEAGYVQIDATHRVPLRFVTPDERCPTCGSAGGCAPVPMRGRQGLWTPTWEAG